MTAATDLRGGWRASLLIAATFVYFLIYAQFAFLARLTELGLSAAALKPVMAAMALAGIAASLVAGYTVERAYLRRRLAAAWLVCAAAAALSLAPLPLAGCLVVAVLIGAGLGTLTVTTVTFLGRFTGRRPLLEVALGTGLGYFCCNIPAIFTASPRAQAAVAIAACAAGLLASWSPRAGDDAKPLASSLSPLASSLSAFTALIWFDSAAFFIIQSTPSLKAGTWTGNLHLWTNGSLHLVAALACAWLLGRFGVRVPQALAVVALAAACLLLDFHHAPLASVLYPVGVSLYSVALSAYPSLLAGHLPLAERGRRAAWLYAVAGWMGSAMGIGMAQNLGLVPLWFIALASAVVLLPALAGLLRTRRVETLAVLTLLAVTALATRLVSPSRPQPGLTAIARGRQVYLSEGCIHCHSQYVRPRSQDVLLWGPTETLAELREQHPPLIGNRRQGPDLAEVGSRRSALWLTAHFHDPRALVPQSFMPSYAALFATESQSAPGSTPGNTRGPDLVAYLESLHTSDVPQHLAEEAAWRPATSAPDPGRAAQLYRQYCATCHDPHGETRLRWQASFRVLPPDFLAGNLPFVDATPAPNRFAALARVIKFGIPGTDMPGHEVLRDADISALANWILAAGEPAAPHPSADSSLKGTP